MEVWRILLDIVVLLAVGAALGGLFERWRQSAILGYLSTGILLGPNALHLVQSSEEVLALSELGVALLLFVIGLEFSWRRLRGMGGAALSGGALQIVATLFAFGAIPLALGQSLGTSLTIGAMGALSSTACVLRILSRRGEVENVHGERALAVLLVQDIAVVPLVLLVSVLSVGGSTETAIKELARTTGIGIGLVAGLWIVFHLIVPRLLATHTVRSNRELPLLFAVASGLGSGVVAYSAGVSPALGAFVAGMLLAESPFAVQVRADVSSLKTLLLTLFFAAMGMLCDVRWIIAHADVVALTVGAVVLGKTVITWGALRATKTTSATALASAICLAQVGEFSFVLADIARGTLLDENTFKLVVSATVLTMILTPFLVAQARPLSARFVGASKPSAEPDAKDSTIPIGIVVGFGPAGQAASEEIAELGCHVVIIDQQPTAVETARGLGYTVVTGDASFGAVLEHAQLSRAAFVVVTVPESATATHIVRYVRNNAPDALVIARARFHLWIPELDAAGAHAVVDEEYEVGRRIAETIRQITDDSAAPSV